MSAKVWSTPLRETLAEGLGDSVSVADAGSRSAHALVATSQPRLATLIRF